MPIYATPPRKTGYPRTVNTIGKRGVTLTTVIGAAGRATYEHAEAERLQRADELFGPRSLSLERAMVESDPIAYWPLAPGYGANGCDDYSGSEHHGTPTSFAFVQDGQLCGFNPGGVDLSENANQRVAVGSLLPYSGTRSFMGWARRDSGATNHILIGGASTTDPSLRITTVEDFQWKRDDLDAGATLAGTFFAPSAWHHWALVDDLSGGQSYFYYDGNFAGQVAYSVPYVVGAGAFRIGTRGSGTGWDGAQAQVAVYDRLLTSAEIARIYAAGSGRAA